MLRCNASDSFGSLRRNRIVDDTSFAVNRDFNRQVFVVKA